MNLHNCVELIGEVVSEGIFSHEVFGEKFYFYKLEVERMSGSADTIPLVISETLLSGSLMGRVIKVQGEYRSYNQVCENGLAHLHLFVFVQNIEYYEGMVVCRHNNLIELKGYLCKSPVYRKTPLGREIADIMLAVNRAYGKSDYIPCILWGRRAQRAGNLMTGDSLQIKGRIQSRAYWKHISETEREERTAYEVSCLCVTFLDAGVGKLGAAGESR